MIDLKKKNRRRFNKDKFLRKRQIGKYGSFLHSECPVCGEDTFFYDRYDSIVCFYCDAWFSKACDDVNCPFCSDRPETPSQALLLETDEKVTEPIDRKERLMLKFSSRYNGKLKKKRKHDKYIIWEESKWQRE